MSAHGRARAARHKHVGAHTRVAEIRHGVDPPGARRGDIIREAPVHTVRLLLLRRNCIALKDEGIVKAVSDIG